MIFTVTMLAVSLFYDPVGCSPGNFRPIADGACISCPENSNRGAATDDERMCMCVENFRRRPMYDPEDGCLRKFVLYYNYACISTCRQGSNFITLHSLVAL